MQSGSPAHEKLVETVKERYGRTAAEGTSCCGPGACGSSAGEKMTLGVGYSKDQLKAIPEGADLGLGCGAPLNYLALRAGETVLDLGSGAGIDVFLAANAVGPAGRAIGVDMTPEMLARARRNAERRGLSNTEFREGRLEALPVANDSIDAVTSNCVINLVPDKAKVFSEVARVLKPGGRLVISDMVLERRLPERVEKDVFAYVGCISGAMMKDHYFEQLKASGLTEIEVLKELDYVAVLAEQGPEEAQSLLARNGVTLDELRGCVKSLTFRATKPGGAAMA